jgi:uncharacterized membrane protein
MERPGVDRRAGFLLRVLLGIALAVGWAGDAAPPAQGRHEPDAAGDGQKPPMEGEGLTPPMEGGQPRPPPESFGHKLIDWLGKFHPPAANFPIALLVAAALAEFLGMLRRSPVLDGASRFCIWFGALMAAVTGILGWFMGGFQVSDRDWTMTVHRWLGTAADACALVALVLSEIGRRPGNANVRSLFRALLFLVALMVLAAGFFGGALIYGLHHYEWR